MCGLMPLGQGESYNLSRYPNLARYMASNVTQTSTTHTPTFTDATASTTKNPYRQHESQNPETETETDSHNGNETSSEPVRQIQGQGQQQQQQQPETQYQFLTPYTIQSHLTVPNTLTTAEVLSSTAWRWCPVCLCFDLLLGGWGAK